MYKVEVKNTGDTTFQVKSKGAHLTIGTEGKGITPLETFLASLGACMGFYIRLFSSQNDLFIKGFSITVQAELSKERPYRFKTINIAVDISDPALDKAAKAKLTEFIRSCPVNNTLSTAPDINISIK